MRRPATGRETWHVFNRGARRLLLFYKDADYHHFLKLLQEAAEASGCIVIAYTIMSNHYHLILEATSLELSRCMHRLGLLYSKYHNKRHDLSGHAFDGPYRAYPQASPMLLMNKVAYVFLNPVKAGMVRNPEDYPWSCFKSYLGRPGSPLGVNPNGVFEKVSRDPKLAKRLFMREIDRETRRPVGSRSGIPSAAHLYREQFARLMEHAREGWNGEDGEDPAIVALYWGKRCGLPLIQMAKAMGEQNRHRLSQAIYRLSRKADKDPALANRLQLP